MRREKIKESIYLAENLYNLRTKNKMTQREVAGEIQMTYQSYQAYELGLAVPNFVNLIKLSKLFNVSLDDLIKKS